MAVFPDTFLWGAATAGHQVEGNNVLSDIWAMEHIPSTPFHEPSGDACDSYHRYGEDIAIVAAAGLNSYRFSIEWSRIEPEEGMFSRAELDHYLSMVQHCLRQGVTPVVTLNHFTVPAWFARGGAWNRTDAASLFERYATHVVEHMRGAVRWWITFNEPNAGAMLLATGNLPLAAMEDSGPVADAHRTIADEYAARIGGEPGIATMALPILTPAGLGQVFDAHRRARAAIKKVQPDALVGWSIATQDYQAVDGGQQKMDAIIDAALRPFWEEARNDDFIGVQTYTRTVVGPEGPIRAEVNADTFQTGWEYYPAALGHTVRAAGEATGRPVLITENGIATADDTQRIRYTEAALQGLRETMEQGTEVLGYIHWTLLDNWEWHTGFAMTFGLVAVDLETYERTPKPSLAWLGEVATSHGAVLGELATR